MSIYFCLCDSTCDSDTKYTYLDSLFIFRFKLTIPVVSLKTTKTVINLKILRY